MEPKWNEQGLVPAIAQNARTGEVLMMAWMNAEAWRLTNETKLAHFWSRSRKALWKKGETSGNTLAIEEIRLDCDEDTILLAVTPAGPACHTGERTCFHKKEGAEIPAPLPAPGGAVLRELADVIADRKRNPVEGSYTAKLFAQGPNEIAKKVGEESAEVIVAALGQSGERLAEETADLLYHAMVLLAARGVSWEAVEKVLEKRRK
jgi:phosphoribosyl-AMP cyclohydrolase / phosphoribosyl-ATP pyrophosphohydrolase